MTSKKEKNVETRKSLLAGVSIMAAAAAAITATPALAQDAEEEEAIVVTGTRLVRQDFEAISPITTVGAEQLELTATLTTDTLLNELPQIVPGNTITSNNVGGEDFSTVDLRGLGVNRTLVLVNGERVPGSSTFGTVDLATIPASLISRIEVVTGGASAVYGSDAVAGVVNFVLKDDYEGAEINTTYRAEMETGNAAAFEINGLVGGNFANGRGNITAYASYYNRDGVYQSEYDYSRVAGAVCYNDNRPLDNQYFICDSVEEARANAASGGTIIAPLAGGSSSAPWGTITNSTTNRFTAGGAGGILANVPGGFTGGTFASYDHDCNPATANIAYSGAATAGNLSFASNGNLSPVFNAGACRIPDRAAGSSLYNYAPDNYVVVPAERISLTTNGHYDITDDVRLNVLMNYTNSRQSVQLAPTPATGLTVRLTPNMRDLIRFGADGLDGNDDDHDDLWAALMSRPTPYAPFTMSRRTNELGARRADSENSAFYFLTSLEGSLGENWDWALGGSYGQSHFITRTQHSANKSRLLAGLSGCQALTPGLDGVLGTADDGGAALPDNGGGTSVFPCVPLDIFGAGTLNAGMVGYLDTTTFNQTIVEENRLTGYIRGDLFELPAGPIAAVFGFEYRDSQLEFHVDNEQRMGNIFGFNALQDQMGSIDVYELYTEVAVPLVAEQPFFHYLGLEAGFRRSNYSTVGNVDTYKIGGEWAPVEWLRFRAMFNEATRAPNVFELFQAGDQGFITTQDPCNDGDEDGNPDGAGTTLAECIATGIPAAAYPGFAQANGQIQGFAFGNQNLTPETAETLTYGVVFQPDWFPIGDFRATVDYYDIEVQDVILGLGVAFYLGDCYTNDVAASCNRVQRLPSGQIDYVNTFRSNQAVLATSGIDFQFEWSIPIGPGQFTINELYSVLDEYLINTTDYAGTTSAGIGAAYPDFKSVLTLTYNVGDWTIFGRWFHTPEVTSSPLNGFGGIGGPALANISPAADYFDLSARWAITDNFSITGVIDNVFDEYPPQTADGFAGQGNVDPALYPRPLGRQFAISGRYRF
jgi:iron complex outermembrane receptor protein